MKKSIRTQSNRQKSLVAELAKQAQQGNDISRWFNNLPRSQRKTLAEIAQANTS